MYGGAGLIPLRVPDNFPPNNLEFGGSMALPDYETEISKSLNWLIFWA